MKQTTSYERSERSSSVCVLLGLHIHVRVTVTFSFFVLRNKEGVEQFFELLQVLLCSFGGIQRTVHYNFPQTTLIL